MLRKTALIATLLATPAAAQNIVKTAPAAAPTRANAAPLGGVSNILIPGGGVSNAGGDNCTSPNTLGYGTPNVGIAINLQHNPDYCVRIRKVRVWLDIALVSGNKFYANVAANLMLQDKDSRQAYEAALKWNTIK